MSLGLFKSPFSYTSQHCQQMIRASTASTKQLLVDIWINQLLCKMMLCSLLWSSAISGSPEHSSLLLLGLDSLAVEHSELHLGHEHKHSVPDSWGWMAEHLEAFVSFVPNTIPGECTRMGYFAFAFVSFSSAKVLTYLGLDLLCKAGWFHINKLQCML